MDLLKKFINFLFIPMNNKIIEDKHITLVKFTQVSSSFSSSIHANTLTVLRQNIRFTINVVTKVYLLFGKNIQPRSSDVLLLQLYLYHHRLRNACDVVLPTSSFSCAGSENVSKSYKLKMVTQSYSFKTFNAKTYSISSSK